MLADRSSPSTQLVFSDATTMSSRLLTATVRPIHASYRFEAARGTNRRTHSHDVFHLVVVSRGSGSFLVGRACLDAMAGSTFLIEPGVPHSFTVPDGRWLQYDEITFSAATTGCWADLLADHLTVPRQGLTLQADHARLASLAIHRFMRTMVAHRRAVAEAYLDVLLDAVLAGSNEAPVHGTDAIATAREYIERNYAEQFSLDELAATVGLSGKHLCRRFGARYGLSPFALKRSVALDHAATLVTATDYPVQMIARIVGYDDVFHFSKAFKRRYGVSPRSYRCSV